MTEHERWKQVEKLYLAVLEREENDRRTFLASECGGDEELRREVESLLRYEGRAEVAFAEPAVDVAARQLAQRPANSVAQAGRLEAGTRLGTFEITTLLGVGGMGEVYRARDTKLGRDVAIKVLPDEFAQDPKRLARFEREARALAALNHPGIAAIFGLDEEDGIQFLVLELIKGETLAQNVARAPLAIGEALAMCRQIAEALEAAHERGLIHRDLKPGNVMVTPTGTVKLLDFGLAKAVEAVQKGMDPIQSPIISARATSQGAILGTAAYMSPEQARGRSLDKRTDIWSFGCLVYELLTGKRAFAAETVSDTITAVLSQEPDWAALPRATPSSIRTLLERCLRKERGRRLHDIADARIEIEDALQQAGGGAMAAPVPLPPTPEKRPRWAWRTMSIVGWLLAVGVAWLLRPTALPPRVTGTRQLTADGRTKVRKGWANRLVTDGSRVYFRVLGTEPASIGQAPIAGGETLLTPTPFSSIEIMDISRDGSELLIQDASGALRQWPYWSLPIPTGAPRRLGNIVGAGGAWSPDGRKLAYGQGNSVYLANANGTDPARLAELPSSPRMFCWSPEGSALRMRASGRYWQIGADGSDLHAIELHPSSSPLHAQWTHDGRYFIYLNHGDIWARREHLSLLRRASRDPVKLTSGPMRYVSLRASRDGSQIFALGVMERGELVRYDQEAGEFIPYLSGISAEMLDFSRDGEWVAYVTFPDGVLWRSRCDGSERLPLTGSLMHPLLPRWSPDGRQIAFNAWSSERVSQIYVIPADGGAAERVFPEQRNQWEAAWSPDGGFIAFTDAWARDTSELRILELATGEVETVPSPEGVYSACWSPNGRHILASTRDMRHLLLDVSSRTWADMGTRGQWIRWSSDARHYYYLGLDFVAVYRVAVSDRSAERIVNLEGFRHTGSIGGGVTFAVTPDDSPLLLRDTGSQEIYALDWEAP